MNFPNLKEKFPVWLDRVKQISKAWRELNSEKRQEFVELARKNRVNCPTPRRRQRRTNSFGNPVQPGNVQQATNDIDQTIQKELLNINQRVLVDNQIKKEETIQQTEEHASTFISQSILTNSIDELKVEECEQQAGQIATNRALEIQQELKKEEEKIEQMKKLKRSLAAKQRQIVKRIEPTTPDEAEKRESDLKEIEANLNSAKKAVQNQQRIVDKCRQRFKECFAPQQQKFPILSSLPSTSTTPTDIYSLSKVEAKGNKNILPEPYFSDQPNTSNAFIDANAITLVQSAKGTRGRKRKKPINQTRASMLGGIPYVNIKSEEDKEVYDVVDNILNIIEMNNPEKADDALFVKRILLSQQQWDHQEQHTSSKGAEALKTKKKRQLQTKSRNQPDLNTEFEIIQDRIKGTISSIPKISNTLEQYHANDKTMLKYPNQTGLPDRCNFSTERKDIGHFCLQFMPDFYEELENCRDDFIDVESLFPPTMSEICMAVDLDALESFDSKEESESDINKRDQIGGTSIPKNDLDLPFLSIDNFSKRTSLVRSMLLMGNVGPEKEVPIDPHWSRFDEELTNLDREVEIIVEIDPSKLPRDELMANMAKLLGITDIAGVMEIETPPQTPASPFSLTRTPNPSSIQQQIKMESPLESDITKKTCIKCNESLSPNCQWIEESPNRLGLQDEDAKILFCSRACYFKFVAIKKLPLTVELLEEAERCVDKETIEILRETSVANFAKQINARINQQLGQFEENRVHHLHSSGADTPEILADNAYLPREFHIRSSDLPTFLQTSGVGQEKRKKSGESYKWIGHSWMKYNSELMDSFKFQQEGIKQKIAYCQSQIPAKIKSLLQMDTRHCSFCGQIGDGDQELTGRLLNVDVNEWVHVNCCLWSAEVHCSEEGALVNVELALRKARGVECKICGRMGASIRCYKLDCANKDFAFHLPCAKYSNGQFVKDKTFYCANHEIRTDALINQFSALRRLFVYRDENHLLSKIFNHSSATEMVMRVGSLIFQKIGQLLPEQLKAFTTPDYIFPVGYKITRLFWPLTNLSIAERMRYECTIADKDGAPEFILKVAEMNREYRGEKPLTAWWEVLKSISLLREKNTLGILRFFPTQISGESLFGFTEPSISKMLESLPGIDQLYTYTFKHGGTPLMDLPLAENPSGAARCEPCFRTLVKRKHRPIISNSPKKIEAKAHNSEAVISREGRVRNASSRFSSLPSAKMDQEMLKAYKASGISERMLQSPYLRNNEAAQMITMYKEMKKEWRENVYLARSKIQGLGLYAKQDLDMNQMIIEYIGEMIRNEVCEMRQKRYTEQNRGEYMFRIDVDWVVDATMAGGPARYINHSCDPNCGTKILTVNEEKKIVIYANRPIKAGEELTYDYQFEIEETSKKIPCLCEAPNCARWMN